MKPNKRIGRVTASIVVIGTLLFHISILSAYGQEGDLEARKARYNRSKINIGDGRHAKMIEEAVADTIVSSPFASAGTKATAQQYKDDHTLNRIWGASSLLVPVLTAVVINLISQTATQDAQTQSLMMAITPSVAALGAISFAISHMLAPKLPPVTVDSYNQDLRENLNLSEADVLGQ